MTDDSMEQDDVASDFLQALERLQRGVPGNEELQSRHAAGRLRVNVASVALEAGHSRTLIGHDKCPYPNVRKQVLLAVRGDPEKKSETLKNKIVRLRNENSELQDKLDLVVTANAELLLRVRNAEKGLFGDGRPLKRATKSERLGAISIVGKKQSTP
ncbi:hypothetical protein SAMN05444168_1556 [Paraburkholderia phenazinium]|uniref:Uncharacterized protein n=1 Tax=Paraburkholderia phenazinium TaxID=60549 RepID=A0A1N6FGP1_9BURK|nr:hypothetical protein SAMN05444168_1556 [Paraburkholderia phenazinium]